MEWFTNIPFLPFLFSAVTMVLIVLWPVFPLPLPRRSDLSLRKYRMVGKIVSLLLFFDVRRGHRLPGTIYLFTLFFSLFTHSGERSSNGPVIVLPLHGREKIVSSEHGPFLLSAGWSLLFSPIYKKRGSVYQLLFLPLSPLSLAGDHY